MCYPFHISQIFIFAIELRNYDLSVDGQREEDITDVLKVVGLGSHGDLGGLLKARGLHEDAEVREVLQGQGLWNRRTREPRVRESCFGSESRIAIGNQLFDEVFGIVGDVVPVLCVEIDFSSHDASNDRERIFTLEWRVATKKNI